MMSVWIPLLIANLWFILAVSTPFRTTALIGFTNTVVWMLFAAGAAGVFS